MKNIPYHIRKLKDTIKLFISYDLLDDSKQIQQRNEES